MNNGRKYCIWLALGLMVLAGCEPSPTGDSSLRGIESKEGSLNIMYYDEQTFMQDYGRLFLSKYPNIDINIHPIRNKYNLDEDYYEWLQTFIEDHDLDILLLNTDAYAKLASEGGLYDLGIRMEKDGYDIKTLSEPVIEAMISEGGGKLYGLAPRYSSKALFFNTDLFDRYGVAYPEEGMSWDELITLSQRFNRDHTESYGIQFLDGYTPSELVFAMARSRELSLVDPATQSMTANTDAWRQLVQTIAELNKQGALAVSRAVDGPASVEQAFKSNPFIAGESAMVVHRYGFIETLNRAQQVLKDNFPKWEVVSLPVDPYHPDVSYEYDMEPVFAISSRSANFDEAWEFIQFMVGEHFTTVKAHHSQEMLLTRKIGDPISNLRFRDAFDRWKPAFSRMGMEQLDSRLQAGMESLVSDDLDAAILGEETVEEALTEIQQEGLRLMEEARAGRKNDRFERTSEKAKTAID